MRIWGKVIIEVLVCWLLASVNRLRDWQPLRESLENIVRMPQVMATRAPALEVRRARLSRGPTGFNRRSDL